MYRLFLGLIFLLLAAATPAWSQAAQGLACQMPEDAVTPSSPLSNTAAALSKTHALDILALGSGSTVGDSGNAAGPALSIQTPQRSFPYRMVEALHGMRPGVQFNLTVQGGKSMTAEEMLAILKREIQVHHYDIVLWQTGTVEAVHGVRPDALRGVLEDGADAVAQVHADLVLIDPQFSRFLRANVDVGPYETVLRQLTSSPEVTLFPRFDLTQTWVGTGEVDLERVSRDQRDKTIGLLNDCLGQALARFVLAGVAEH